MRVQLPAPSRRALLGLASGLTALTVTGCDLDDVRAPEASSEPSDRGSTSSAADSDDALVTSTTARITEARDLAAAAAGGSDSVSTAATALVTLHDTHLAALAPDDETSPTPSPTSKPTSESDEARTVSLARLRRSESALQADLASNAVAAANAELAQLLGSMSAAVAQQVTRLSTGAGR